MKESSADTSQTLVGALRQRLAPRSASSAASYTWPVAISVLFHGVVLLFLAIGWSPGEKPRKVVTPRYVEAQLLQMNAPMVQAPAPQPQPKPQPKPQPEPTPEPEPEPEPEPREDTSAREREEQQRQEQQRQEAVKQQQLRDEQLRREQETKARADAERKRQEEQKVKEEQAKAEAERKRQEEQKRQEELKRQQAERERQEREAQARAQAQAQADAEASEQLVGSYLGYIQQRVGSSWSRPPSARLGMVAELEIRLDGQARVTGVRVVKSSGNAAFDQSAEQAVRRVEHFDRLRELIQQDRAAFEQNFRTFILVFNPQDLRQ